MKKHFTKNNAKLVLLLVVLSSLLILPGLKNLSLDYRYENFFPKNDPAVEEYNQFIQQFESDNDFLVIAVKSKNGVFNTHFLNKVDSLTKALSQIPNVKKVTSPTTLKYPIKGPFGYTQVPYIHLHKPELFEKDSAKIFNTENLNGGIFSSTQAAVSILIMHESNLKKPVNDALYLSVKSTAQKMEFDELHIAGKIKGQYYFIDTLTTELVMFLIISVVLISIFLFITFKNSWGVWVPLSVVLLCTAWLFGLMGYFGKQINIMTTTIPTILFVVGISNVVHILEKYIEELRKGTTKKTAIFTAFKEVGVATFLTCLTTAVGFISLTNSNINPIKEFGWLTALGVFICFLLAFSMLPSVLANTAPPSIAKKQIHMLFWSKNLHSTFLWLVNRKLRVLFGFIIVAIIGSIGFMQLKTDNKFVVDWLINESDVRDYEYFENNFSGFRPMEIAIYSTDNESILSLEKLKALQSLDSAIRQNFKAKLIISPLQFIKTANQAINGGNIEAYTLPESDKSLNKIIRERSKFKVKEIDNYLSEDELTARMSAKVIDLGGAKMNELNGTTYNAMQAKLNEVGLSFSITGMPALLDKNNEYLASNIIEGLLTAFLVVGLIMGVLFKSWRIVLITLLPNIFPLYFIAAFMGFTGIDLKIATSIIFTIAFGIAVDDTIHFMTKFRLELAKGKSMVYALKRTYISTGKAIIITSLVLFAGFFIFLLSAVPSTFYIGLLVSSTLLFAVISNILLLPVLILLFFKTEKNELRQKF